MRKIALFVIVLSLVAACQILPSTGDTSTGPGAAQNYFPTLPGYNVTEAASITDALTKVGTGASAVSGNVPLAGAVARLDSMIQCYQAVGAVDARIYTEQNLSVIPKIGVLAVINETRLQRNLVNCAINTASDGAVGAQSAGVQPCGGSGTFVVNNETIRYLYGATTSELCASFQAQFPG